MFLFSEIWLFLIVIFLNYTNNYIFYIMDRIKVSMEPLWNSTTVRLTVSLTIYNISQWLS